MKKHFNFQHDVSITKYYFVCDICKHAFCASINRLDKLRSCPYCFSETLCEHKDCKFCSDKFFISEAKDKKLKNKDNHYYL